MKVSPLNIKKPTDVNKMRVYLRLAFLTLAILLVMGWLIPTFISSGSNLLVMIGVILFILIIPAAYYGYKWSIKNDARQDSSGDGS